MKRCSSIKLSFSLVPRQAVSGQNGVHQDLYPGRLGEDGVGGAAGEEELRQVQAWPPEDGEVGLNDESRDPDSKRGEETGRESRSGEKGRVRGEGERGAEAHGQAQPGP